MNRRNVLLGLGTAAAGSGIVFGSGAFTQVQASRDVTIGVDRDSEALIELNPNSSVASVVEDNETGELVIDTTRLDSDDSAGFNVGSTVEIGEIDSNGDVPNDDFAFKLVNNLNNDDGSGASEDSAGDFDGTVDIEIDLTDFEALDNGATFELVATPSNGSTQTIADGSSEVFSSVDPDEEIYVAIRVETFNSGDPEDITGEVVFRAGSDLADSDFVQQRERDDLLLENGDSLQISQAAITSNGAASGSGLDLLQDAFGADGNDSRGTFKIDGYDATQLDLEISAKFSDEIDASDLSQSSGGTIGPASGSAGLTAIDGVRIAVVNNFSGDIDYTKSDLDAAGRLTGPTEDGGSGRAYFSRVSDVNDNVQSGRSIPAVVDGAEVDPDRTESGGGVQQVIGQLESGSEPDISSVSLEEVTVTATNGKSVEQEVTGVTVNDTDIQLSDLDVTADDNSS